MRLNKDLKLRKVGPYSIIVRVSGPDTDLTDVLSLNETSSWLWQKAQGKDFTPDQLAGWLCEEYEVDKETALADVKETLDIWIRFGLVWTE